VIFNKLPDAYRAYLVNEYDLKYERSLVSELSSNKNVFIEFRYIDSGAVKSCTPDGIRRLGEFWKAELDKLPILLDHQGKIVLSN
jgi:hypothetical protein